MNVALGRELRHLRYAVIEGLRASAAIGMTIFILSTLPWVFHQETPIIWYAGNAAKLGGTIAVASFVIFATWARWELWRNNQVKPK